MELQVSNTVAYRGRKKF